MIIILIDITTRSTTWLLISEAEVDGAFEKKLLISRCAECTVAEDKPICVPLKYCPSVCLWVCLSIPQFVRPYIRLVVRTSFCLWVLWQFCNIQFSFMHLFDKRMQPKCGLFCTKYARFAIIVKDLSVDTAEVAFLSGCDSLR